VPLLVARVVRKKCLSECNRTLVHTCPCGLLLKVRQHFCSTLYVVTLALEPKEGPKQRGGVAYSDTILSQRFGEDVEYGRVPVSAKVQRSRVEVDNPFLGIPRTLVPF
jgi:hypothetical protein